jgi:hypothetical protein
VRGVDRRRLPARRREGLRAGRDSADAFIVSAQTERGMALFLVPRDASGLSIALHDRIDGGTWSTLTVGPTRGRRRGACATGDDTAARLDARRSTRHVWRSPPSSSA